MNKLKSILIKWIQKPKNNWTESEYIQYTVVPCIMIGAFVA